MDTSSWPKDMHLGYAQNVIRRIDEEDDTRIISTDKKAEKAGGLYLALDGTLVKPTDDIDTDKEYQLIALPE
jgi:hypothetical protein